MASVDSPQAWVPYEPTKDCSQGFCSIYCPQWCYIIFPPPPPFEFSDDSSSGPTLSPLVIAIIGILASAFLLVSYYTIVSKYCGGFESLRRRMNLGGAGDDVNDDVAGGQLRHHDAWRMTVNDGLEESVIRSIAECKYKKGDGFVDSTDCSVCLAEFKEDETLRLLPKCSHAFHIRCIDTWLKSHSNCPLCRAIVVTPISTVPSQPPVTPVEQGSPTPVSNETVISMEDMERGGEQENGMVPKDPRRAHGELGDGIIEIEDGWLRPIRRSFSMDASCHDRVLIGDVLEMGTGDYGPSSATSGGEGSSSQIAEEQSKGRSKALHSVMSPVRMKRSFSSGRFNLHKHGKGNNTSVLPM